LQRGPKAKLPHPTNSIFRSDCHLPAMIRLTGGYARLYDMLDLAARSNLCKLSPPSLVPCHTSHLSAFNSPNPLYPSPLTAPSLPLLPTSQARLLPPLWTDTTISSLAGRSRRRRPGSLRLADQDVDSELQTCIAICEEKSKASLA
jgi:hypothetical protein